MRRKVTVYLTDEELSQMRRAAARRRLSLSRHMMERLISAEHEENAVALNGGELAAEQGFAKAVEAAVGRAVRPLSQNLGILTAMLDQLALSMLINTPEVPEAKREQALAVGERRHHGWRLAVEDLLRQMHPEVVGDNHDNAGNGAHA